MALFYCVILSLICLWAQTYGGDTKSFLTRKWLTASLVVFGIIVLVLNPKQSNPSELADEENDYDSNAGSMDEHWDLEELRHRLVLTQRKLTAQDRDYESKISRLDANVDDLLGRFSKRLRGDKYVSTVQTPDVHLFPLIAESN